LKTHPVIITAPFGIRLDPIQHNGHVFETSILLNSSIMHINNQHELLAIRAGHILLTFISNTVEITLTNNVSHPSEPVITSEPLATHLDPDDDLNLLYLTPPPSPVSLTNDQHNDTDHGFVEDEQPNYLYPTPLPPSLTDQPDPDVYYSTTHWPSNQKQSYPHRQLSMHSRHVQPNNETTPEDWSMDIDLHSDESYNYTNTNGPKPSPTDWYDQTPTNITYRPKVLPKNDNHDAEHDPAASVMLTTTHFPLI
jgi:hypothetical protein